MGGTGGRGDSNFYFRIESIDLYLNGLECNIGFTKAN